MKLIKSFIFGEEDNSFVIGMDDLIRHSAIRVNIHICIKLYSLSLQTRTLTRNPSKTLIEVYFKNYFLEKYSLKHSNSDIFYLRTKEA